MIDETRKAIKWGRSKTLVVSLPRRWTKKFAIQPDSQLRIQETPDGSLKITPLDLTEPIPLREITLRLLEQDELTLSTILENYFVGGYDQVILESSRRFTDPVRNLIIKITHQLPGYEIIDTTDRSIKIKGITSIRGEDILEFVKMSSRIPLELLTKIIKALKAGPDETEIIANEIISDAWRERGNYLRVQRELRKALVKTPPGLNLTSDKIVDTVYYVLQLGNIHENILHIAEALTRRQPLKEQDKIAVAALTKVRDNLKGAISAFLQRNQEMVHKVLGEIPLLRQWKRQTETIVDVMPDSVITQIILDRMEEMLSYSSGIAKTALLLKS
jgi:phosphate uptake regulator